MAVIAVPCAAADPAPGGSAPVGMMQARYEDASRLDWAGSRARPLAATVWYPAAAGAREQPWTVGIFQAGHVAPDAPMAPRPAKLPLIVLSHGTGGAAPLLGWLAQALAARGYLVAAVNHHGNTSAEPAYRLEGFLAWWHRPQDVSAVIDRLLADPRFGPRIDASCIGAAGFSLGGYTTLALVGARLGRMQWRDACARTPDDPSCRLPPEVAGQFTPEAVNQWLDDDGPMKAEIVRMEHDYRDPRVKAAYAIAPVLGPALQASSLARINVPVRIVVGSADDQSVPDTTARPVARLIPQAELEVLPRVTHYSFLAECTPLGRSAAPPLCVDPPGVDRAALHARVAADAVAFFEKTLR